MTCATYRFEGNDSFLCISVPGATHIRSLHPRTLKEESAYGDHRPRICSSFLCGCNSTDCRRSSESWHCYFADEGSRALARDIDSAGFTALGPPLPECYTVAQNTNHAQCAFYAITISYACWSPPHLWLRTTCSRRNSSVVNHPTTSKDWESN